MSLRALTPAFVATISALAYGTACNPPKPAPPRPETGNPPEPAPTAAPPTATAFSSVHVAPTARATATATAAVKTPPKQYNPRDDEGRTIVRSYQGDGCLVYLPYPKLKPGELRLPGTAPPQKAVACPAVMMDKAFENCREGTLSGRGEKCMCFRPGNPPRRYVSACPASSQ